MNNDKYKVNIGIEIHCTLNTKTKLFSPSLNWSTIMLFHKELSKFSNKLSNTIITPIDLGYPGYMPVPNKEAVHKSLLACSILKTKKIAKELRFDRKHYFYPDLPKGYQITQFYNPIGENGYLEIILENGIKKQIGISKIILEEDTANMIHEREYTKINYNRAGNPLLEIVSEPNISNSYEAIEYIKELRRKLIFAGISFARFEWGLFRCDLNVSVSKKTSKEMGTRIEIKNLNSLENIKKAIENEIEELIKLNEKNELIRQQTKRFDEFTQKNKFMRFKETEIDYKYLRDPMFGLYNVSNLIFFNKSEIYTDFYFKYFDRQRIDEIIELSNFHLFIYSISCLFEINDIINLTTHYKFEDFVKKDFDDFYLYFINYCNPILNQEISKQLKNFFEKRHDVSSICSDLEVTKIFESYMLKLFEITKEKNVIYKIFFLWKKQFPKYSNINLMKEDIKKFFSDPEKWEQVPDPAKWQLPTQFEQTEIDEESLLHVTISNLDLKKILVEYKNRPDRVINGIFGQIMKNNKENIEKINPASLKQKLQDKLDELIKNEKKDN